MDGLCFLWILSDDAQAMNELGDPLKPALDQSLLRDPYQLLQQLGVRGAKPTWLAEDRTTEIDPESFKIGWSHFGPDRLPHPTKTGVTQAIAGVEVALGHEEGEIR